ncbi:MAG: metal-dependent transcriptional regulator [Dermatophilus congolensis]|nr:metal-dependent transcriptional regulator [Dermatophilus congolensis]
MSNLIDTTEMYLRTILELEEEGVPALRARIAERLDHSGPTVSQTVARMERDGLLTVLGDRTLELSTSGRERATRVMRKHRIAERLLIEVIGLEYEHVHEEACRWEHVMSDRVEAKILALLGDHAHSPYGNPIPGLGQFGGQDRPPAPLTRVAAVPDGSVVVLASIGEPLQSEQDILTQMAQAGVVPGASITTRREGSGVVVHGVDTPADQALWLDGELAGFLFVDPVDGARADSDAAGASA